MDAITIGITYLILGIINLSEPYKGQTSIFGVHIFFRWVRLRQVHHFLKIHLLIFAVNWVLMLSYHFLTCSPGHEAVETIVSKCSGIGYIAFGYPLPMMFQVDEADTCVGKICCRRLTPGVTGISSVRVFQDFTSYLMQLVHSMLTCVLNTPFSFIIPALDELDLSSPYRVHTDLPHLSFEHLEKCRRYLIREGIISLLSFVCEFHRYFLSFAAAPVQS